MPYVKLERKTELKSIVEKLYQIIDDSSYNTLGEKLHGIVYHINKNEFSSGDMNYMLTVSCLYYLTKTEGRYADHQDVLDQLFEARENIRPISVMLDTRKLRGALLCCALEFYRRKVAPYEQSCIEKNGDVY